MQKLSITQSAQEDKLGYRLVYILWFLFLFEPARLIAYYIPALDSLKWLPTILLLGAILHWFTSPLEKYNYKWFLIFLLVNLFGTVIAFIEGNWGISRQINRQIFQFFMLGILTLTYFNNYEKIKKLFTLYLLYITYYSLWGIISLKISPLNASIDPGNRAIVPWHIWLDNRDGFGPLMVIGMAFCYYYYQAVEGRKLRILCVVSVLLCVAGVVSSFGRGVFLAMGATLMFIWIQSKKKFAGIILLLLLVGALFVFVSMISPENLYWETMQTISDGTSTGTGGDRKIMWELAWRQFLDHPVFGVGTGNFGIAAVRDLTKEEIQNFGYTTGRLWGRSVHCAPLTILCEYGLVGAIIFIMLNLDFIRANINIKKYTSAKLNVQLNKSNAPFSEMKWFSIIASGLMACFVAFWVNALLYEIIYAPFFWNLIVLNRLLALNQASLALPR